MTTEERWLNFIEDESIIQDIIARFPNDEKDENSGMRRTVMVAALEWAKKAHHNDIASAMYFIPRESNDDVDISELEKSENFRAFQAWWFDHQGDAPLSFIFYMDWIEVLRLLWGKFGK